MDASSETRPPRSPRAVSGTRPPLSNAFAHRRLVPLVASPASSSRASFPTSDTAVQSESRAAQISNSCSVAWPTLLTTLSTKASSFATKPSGAPSGAPDTAPLARAPAVACTSSAIATIPRPSVAPFGRLICSAEWGGDGPAASFGSSSSPPPLLLLLPPKSPSPLQSSFAVSSSILKPRGSVDPRRSDCHGTLASGCRVLPPHREPPTGTVFGLSLP